MKLKNVRSSMLLLMLLGITLSLTIQTGIVKAQEADFAVTVSPSRATVGGDGIARYSIRLTSINGFSGTVTLSVAGLSDRSEFQASYSFQPSVLGLGANLDVYSVLTVTVLTRGYYYPSGYTANQPYTYYYPYGPTIGFNILAVSGSITKTMPVSVDVLRYTTNSLDVTLNLQPSTILLPGEISESSTETLTITVTGQNVLSTDTISITPQLYDPPNGLSASFDPGSGQITGGGAPLQFTANLLMTPEFLVKSGTYRLAVGITAFLPRTTSSLYYYSTYYRGGLFKIAILTIVVPPYLTISANPSIMNVYIGGTDQKMQVQVDTLSSGIIPPISLNVEGIPPGVVANFENVVLTPKGGQPAKTNLVFNAPSTLASGIFPIRISATTFGMTKYTNASIYVRPQGDYSLSTSDQMISLVPRGETHAVTIRIEPQSGFRATIHLSVTQLPPGVTASLSSDTVTVQSDSPVQVVVTFIVSSNAVPGTYNVAIVAGTGISERTTNITLQIRSGTSQIWPIVFLVVTLVGVASAIAFLAIPRGKHVHVIRQG